MSSDLTVYCLSLFIPQVSIIRSKLAMMDFLFPLALGHSAPSPVAGDTTNGAEVQRDIPSRTKKNTLPNKDN